MRTKDSLPLYGTRGILAYDEEQDKVQCAYCGRYFHMLTDGHLQRHGLTVPQYKELYGLNAQTPLTTPRVTAVQRAHAERTGAGSRLVPGTPSPARGHSYPRRAQYLLTHGAPAVQAARGRAKRRWTDEAMLRAVRRLRDERGYVRRCSLAQEPRSLVPSEKALRDRFGSWEMVCALIGQEPPSTGPRWRRGSQQQWTDSELLDWLGTLERTLGRPVSAHYLRTHRSEGRQRLFPSYETLIARFGSWAHVREALTLSPDRSATHVLTAV